MKILYGTTNKAKFQAMRTALEAFDIELIGLADIDSELPSINENGKTPLENAEIKARAYYEAFQIPVFSCDSGLYFDELQEDEQPGLHVRRINGKELTDDEMREYYATLAARHGGRITGRYRNAIYFILDEEHHYSSMDMSIATEPFILVTEPHPKRVEGFPLDSLSVDIGTGKYYYDLDVKDVSTSVDNGVRAFFGAIGNLAEKRNLVRHIKTINIYGENKHEHSTKYREACRGIVLKEDKILLTYEVNTDQWFIPGGGLESGETIKECCARELAEETGYVVDVKEQFLTINEYYEEWHFVSQYFICDSVGETNRTLTEREQKVGLEPRWISLNEAVDIFSKHQDYADVDEMKRGAYLREYQALLSYLDR